MDNLNVTTQTPLRLGEDWIEALVEKDFQRLAGYCHPNVISRLMTPRRMDTLENAADLSAKVQGWFQECASIQKEQVRVTLVGEKLAIFYRLNFEKEGTQRTAEQQIYCTLRDGLVENLSLLCSGFQPVQTPTGNSNSQAVKVDTSQSPVTAQPAVPADALLEMNFSAGSESVCSILTPSIKRKLGEINSGQVLEVRVDDPSARQDIEAWCRLSGNSLLKMEQGPEQQLHFYLIKK